MSGINILASIWVIITIAGCGQTTRHGQETMTYNLTESEYLSLEGGSLLPLPELTAKVSKDLEEIRSNFPVVRNITHNRKWIPGQVLSTKIRMEQIDQLNSSSYGPLTNVEKIDVKPFFFISVISFNKPYSPPVLCEKLESEFGFPCTPNIVYYEYEVDNISYRMSNSTYIFKKGTGMCKDNCEDRLLWEFLIDNNGTASLVKEWSIPQNGERVIIAKK
ncbi:hypothetical protein Ocin01_19927 [Orchesella cincta]|uniref:Lipoprotein n=1 Tax=Orchesella cincta TaxID=48709 RepID=A0A1D2M1A8_ORCCI|nr:hypothetical protein Ocin01_19927 [Orchesella cincta]